MNESINFHGDLQYSHIAHCNCLVCTSIRKRLILFKKDSKRKLFRLDRLKIALIKLSVFIEISHVLDGLISKDRKLGDIFRQITKAKLPLETWEGLYRTLTLEDWLNYFVKEK